MAITQTINRTDTDRVWQNVTNGDAETLTSHFAVFKFLSNQNTASVSTNEAALALTASAGTDVDAVGSFIGLADGNIAAAAVGLVQMYGYHESVNVMRIASSVTVRPGHPIGPGLPADSEGLSSTGFLISWYGPVVALDTITATHHSLGTQTTNFADHVFLRCM